MYSLGLCLLLLALLCPGFPMNWWQNIQKGKKRVAGHSGRLQALQRPIQCSIIRHSFLHMLFIMVQEWLLRIVRPSSEMLQEKEVLFMKYLSSVNGSRPSGKLKKKKKQPYRGLLYSEMMKKVRIFFFRCNKDLQNSLQWIRRFISLL